MQAAPGAPTQGLDLKLATSVCCLLPGVDGIHCVSGLCDLCGDVCDANTQELNVLTCTFKNCQDLPYHQDCLEKVSCRMLPRCPAAHAADSSNAGGLSKRLAACFSVSEEHPLGAQQEDWLQVSQGLWQGQRPQGAMPWKDRQVAPHTPKERRAEKEEEGA